MKLGHILLTIFVFILAASIPAHSMDTLEQEKPDLIAQHINVIVKNNKNWDEATKKDLLHLLEWNSLFERKQNDASKYKQAFVSQFHHQPPTFTRAAGEEYLPKFINTNKAFPEINDPELQKTISIALNNLSKTKIKNFNHRIERENKLIADKLKEMDEGPQYLRPNIQASIDNLIEKQLLTLTLKINENRDRTELEKDAQLLESFKQYISKENTTLLAKLEQTINSYKKILEPEKAEEPAEILFQETPRQPATDLETIEAPVEFILAEQAAKHTIVQPNMESSSDTSAHPELVEGLSAPILYPQLRFSTPGSPYEEDLNMGLTVQDKHEKNSPATHLQPTTTPTTLSPLSPQQSIDVPKEIKQLNPALIKGGIFVPAPEKRYLNEPAPITEEEKKSYMPVIEESTPRSVIKEEPQIPLAPMSTQEKKPSSWWNALVAAANNFISFFKSRSVTPAP